MVTNNEICIFPLHLTISFALYSEKNSFLQKIALIVGMSNINKVNVLNPYVVVYAFIYPNI